MSELPPPIVAKSWPPPHWSTWHPSVTPYPGPDEAFTEWQPSSLRQWWRKRYPSVTDEP